METSGTGPPDGDLPLDVRQRLHSQALFALPVIAIVPVAITVVLATTMALLLGWNPRLVLITMAARSALNLRVVRLIKRRSVILMETIVVVVGAAAFALGLLAWHR